MRHKIENQKNANWRERCSIFLTLDARVRRNLFFFKIVAPRTENLEPKNFLLVGSSVAKIFLGTTTFEHFCVFDQSAPRALDAKSGVARLVRKIVFFIRESRRQDETNAR